MKKKPGKFRNLLKAILICVTFLFNVERSYKTVRLMWMGPNLFMATDCVAKCALKSAADNKHLCDRSFFNTPFQPSVHMDKVTFLGESSWALIEFRKFFRYLTRVIEVNHATIN